MTLISSSFLLNLTLLLTAASAPGREAQTPRTRGKNAVVFRGGTVLWDDFYLELARRHRGRPIGKQSLTHLIDKKIVEIEAARRGSTVSDAELQAGFDKIIKRFGKDKKELPEYLEKKGMSIPGFRAMVKLSLLNEKLVRADLGIGNDSPLRKEQIRLWASDQRRRHKVISDVSKLSHDVCARVGEHRIALRSLGEVMAPGIARSEREMLLEQMVASRLLALEAKRLNLEATDALLDAEITKRRESLEKNVKFKGVSLEQLLAAQGRTIHDFRQGEVLKSQVLVELLGNSIYPKDSLVAEFDKKPGYWLDRVGPSRHVYQLFLRKSKRRSPERLLNALLDLKGKIKSLAYFKQAAVRYSNDASAKSGGSLGFLHREAEGYSESFLAAAHSLPLGRISEPIHEKNGSSLLWVSAIKAAPIGDELYAAMRQFKMRLLLEKLVKESEPRFLK